jgi:hypothetical protein
MRAIAIVVKVVESYHLHLILTTHKASLMTYHFNLSDLSKIMKVRLYLAERREWSSR